MIDPEKEEDEPPYDEPEDEVIMLVDDSYSIDEYFDFIDSYPDNPLPPEEEGRG